MFRWLGLALLLLAAPIVSADIRIASWNIERLGHGNQKSYEALAVIGSEFDFVAVQEVMTSEGLEHFKRALHRRTGEPWSKMYSHRIGRGSYKEKYAFVWRDSAVEYVDGAVVYLDRTDRYAREPYSARFRSKRTGTAFVAATVHILYGRSAGDRTPEIKALADYWEWLAQVYPGTPRMLLGDFNLPPSHSAWNALSSVATPLITQGATTVSSINGRFANLYDNIWVARDTTLRVSSAGIYDGPRALGWSHEKFRRHVSDHVPVYATLGSARVDSIGTTNASLNAPSTHQRSSSLVASADNGEIRGNRNSKIYHLPGCPSYDMIAERNRVSFGSEDDARRSGFRKAGNCR